MCCQDSITGNYDDGENIVMLLWHRQRCSKLLNGFVALFSLHGVSIGKCKLGLCVLYLHGHDHPQVLGSSEGREGLLASLQAAVKKDAVLMMQLNMMLNDVVVSAEKK
jgi:hypothetical protein